MDHVKLNYAMVLECVQVFNYILWFTGSFSEAHVGML